MDDSVIEEARAGDTNAWRSLVAEHLGAVHAICRALGLDSSAAAVVNQAVWLRLAEHLHRIRTPAAVGGWIAATTRRECLYPSRAAQRSGWIAGGLTVRLDDGADPTLVGDSFTLGRCFARLGATCQRLLRLAAVQPSPTEELIGTALDLPVEDVAEACSACRRRLDRLVSLDVANGRRPEVSQPHDRVIAHSDPVPRSWWKAAEAAFGWLCIDAITADVVYDSTETRGDRWKVPLSHRARRSLRFSAGPRQVDVVIDITSGTRDYPEVLLTGRVDPAIRSETLSGKEPGVVARWPGGSAPASVSADGEFRLQDLPLAPLSVEVGAQGSVASAVKTGWIFL